MNHWCTTIDLYSFRTQLESNLSMRAIENKNKNTMRVSIMPYKPQKPVVEIEGYIWPRVKRTTVKRKAVVSPKKRLQQLRKTKRETMKRATSEDDIPCLVDESESFESY